jgi:hypothetical protein
MALVNTDLFLVQDAVSKTNYKVSFENLASQIDTDVNLDGRVAVSGDNMTGNLTLGTTKIVLKTDGEALFAEDRVKVLSTGIIESWRKTNNGADKLHSWHSNIGTSRAERIRFNADGGGVFLGDVAANKFTGDGSGLTNLPIQPVPEKISDLDDVNTSGVADGQMLVYSTDTWVPQNIPTPPTVDLTNYLQKPGSTGEFLVVESGSGVITYSQSTALQPGDDNTALTNAAGFITAADIPTLNYVPLGSWAALPAV